MCNSHGKHCGPATFAWILLLIGGINWGLVGLGMLMGSNWNVVEMLLGRWPTLLAIVYLLVGIAAIAKMIGCKCKVCREGCKDCMAGDKKMPSQM